MTPAPESASPPDAPADTAAPGAGDAKSAAGTIILALNGMTRLEAAHYYRDKLRWAIHPLNAPDEGAETERGKKPKTTGYKSHTVEKTTDRYLSRWFGDGSRNNVGVYARVPHIVIDLDSKPDGGKSVEEWEAAHPELADIPAERTGGGMHLHVTCRGVPPAATVLAGKSGKLVSQLTEKVTAEVFLAGNVALTPSVHPSGHKYRWIRGGPIPEKKWADLCRIFSIPMQPKGKTVNLIEVRGGRWWTAYRGDLTSLDLVALTKALDLYLRELDAESGKHAIRCPWADDHTCNGEERTETSTVIFQPHDGKMPGFKCLHASHANKAAANLLEWAEEKMPGIVDQHCSRKRIWEEGQKSPDGRPRLLLPGIGRPQAEFATEAGAILGPSQRPDRLYLRHDMVVEITEIQIAPKQATVAFSSVKPARAITLAERFAEVGTLVEDPNGESEFVPLSMGKSTAEIMVAAPQFREALPRVDRILDLPIPILCSDGRIRYPRPGYDPDFLTYLVPGAPPIAEMSLDEAKCLLKALFEEFCFKDRQSLVHAIAAFLTPFCRGLFGRWNARTPVFLYKANRERAGKDYLANLRAILYEGRCNEDAPLGSDVPETRKKITSALAAGRRSIHMANCRGHIDNSALEMLATAEVWSDRLLGENTEISIPNELEISLSANTGLTYTPDFANRCRIISLHYEEEDANARVFRRPDLHGWLRANRHRFVSALAALVTHWDRQGRPPGPSPFTSFPLWARTVGGIMTAAGLGDPCLPVPDESGVIDGDRQTGDMKALFRLANETFGEEWVKKDRIYGLLKGDGCELFSWIDLDKRQDTTRFGLLLAKFTGRILGGVRLSRDTSSSRTTNHTYQFAKVPDGARPRPSDDISREVFGNAAPENAHVAHLAHLSSPPYGAPSGAVEEEKKEERNEGANIDGVKVCNVCKVCTPVTDRSLLDDIAEQISISGAPVALDVETYGPKTALNPWQGDIRILSLAIPGVAPWILDLRALGYDLGPLAGVLASGQVLGHNLKFDALWLKQKCGLDLPRVLDTLTASRLLHNGAGLPHDLGRLLERHLSLMLPKELGRFDWGTMILSENQLRYCANDVAHLHRLHDCLSEELERAGLTAVYRMEMELLPRVVDMEAQGFPVDAELLAKYRDTAEAEQKAGEDRLRGLLQSPDLNPSAPAQLREALARVGVNVTSTGEETLLASGDTKYVPTVLEYRAAVKRMQQANTLLSRIESDGRIHGHFEPTGTETGRFSSKEPNLQNIGRGALRACFAAPEGQKLIVADYSQIELRIAAAIAGEMRMIEAYQRGDDLHRQTAALVLDKPVTDVTKQDRQLAKAVNFGLLYGQSAGGLVRYARTAYGLTLTEERAAEIRRRFFAAYTGLAVWHRDNHRVANHGATEVRTVTGRRRLLPTGEDESLERFARLVNTPVQGGSADGIKKAMINIAGKLPSGAAVVSTVHDELIVEAPEADAVAICELVRAEMIAAMVELFPQVPVDVEAHVCDNWGEKA